MNDIFRLRDNTNYHLRHRLQFQFHHRSNSQCPLTVGNQVRIWDPKFGNKYLLKLKITILLMILKKKLESGNL